MKPFSRLRFLNPVQLKKKTTSLIKNVKKKKWDKKRVWKTVGWVALGIFGFILILFAWFYKDLPTPAKIAATKASQSTKIYDRNGVLLYETGDVKRTSIESSQIPKYVKDATVAVEDQSFYQNHGLDFKGIGRAAIRDIFHIGKGTQGGSTITQQYVKNALLYSDQTIVRKIKEAILAIELEFMYSKDEILTMYLNEIPYGGGTAGIEAASTTYYGKQAKDLTLAQAATLAAIPKAPTYYSPYGTHTDKLIIRRDYVLDQMVKTGKITKEEADAAKKEDTTTVGTTVQARKSTMLAPHFAMYVMELAAEQFGEERVNTEGLSITTTLDYEKQKLAETAVTNGMTKVTKYGGSNAALTSIDTKTGEVLAMVGSKDFFDTSIDGNVNIATSNRQPGSSFKPYVYATGFKNKDISPSKILYDVTTDFGGGYTPHNYDGNTHGAVTARQALSNSLNIPAVKMASLAGVKNIIQTATDMGISTLSSNTDYGLALGLGVGEVKLLEHTGGFATFATGGVKHDIKTMLKVTDKSNKVLYEYKQDEDKGTQVLDPQVAYEMQSIMSDNNARALVFGTRSALAFSDRPVAAKTGTTSDFKDAWTVGYTPSVAVGVWVGNNNNKAMSSGADGVVVAAPIFHEYMAAVTKDTAVEQFVAPAGIQTVTVEKYSNKLPTEYSKETTTDIFTSSQVPTEKDDVNVAVKVCKSNGLLAPSGIADALTETKIFSNIHSERPDASNWEGPVIAWAQAAGLYLPVPSSNCNASDVSTPLTVSITSPQPDETLTGTHIITASIGGAENCKNVEFFIDNVSVGVDSSGPYSLSYNFDNVSTGNHILTAVATDTSGVKYKSEVVFSSIKNVDLTISGATADTITSNSAVVTWTTSKNATSQVFYDTSSHSSYTNYASSTSKNSTMEMSHTKTLVGLNPGTTYHFRAVSIDSSNNTVSSGDITFTTLP